MTTTASVAAAVIEVILCHLWATGRLDYQRTVSENYLGTFLWAVTLTHWRVPHFWAIHRVMHPWNTKSIPDVGKILYKRVHSLHHKSSNTTAFSGTNMHPVESLLYYSVR